MTIRDEFFRRAVAKIPCVNCGVWNCTQHAHSNLAAHGKGRGLKSGDEAGMALCNTREGIEGCHVEHDLQKNIEPMDPAEAQTYKYIALTYMGLMNAGLLKVDRAKLK
jgi:hypothetical protein